MVTSYVTKMFWATLRNYFWIINNNNNNNNSEKIITNLRGGPEPFVAFHPAYQNSIIRKKFTVPFLKYKRLELKLRVFLAGHSVAMVTYFITKIIPMYSPVIGQCFDTIIVASSDKEWLILTNQNISLRKCWKLFWATLNSFDLRFTPNLILGVKLVKARFMLLLAGLRYRYSCILNVKFWILT